MGSLVPVKILISFELLLAFTAPSILIFFVFNLRRYAQYKELMDLRLVWTWLGLGGVIGAYFLYYALGITNVLWEQGVWFSENDILHLGLILWMFYIGKFTAPKIRDLE